MGQIRALSCDILPNMGTLLWHSAKSGHSPVTFCQIWAVSYNILPNLGTLLWHSAKSGHSPMTFCQIWALSYVILPNLGTLLQHSAKSGQSPHESFNTLKWISVGLKQICHHPSLQVLAKYGCRSLLVMISELSLNNKVVRCFILMIIHYNSHQNYSLYGWQIF